MPARDTSSKRTTPKQEPPDYSALGKAFTDALELIAEAFRPTILAATVGQGAVRKLVEASNADQGLELSADEVKGLAYLIRSISRQATGR